MRLIDRPAETAAPATSLDLLAARARRGDRRAAAALRKRMTPQARQLALALGVEPRSASAVVRRALYEALDDRDRVYSSAVVAAVQRHGGRARGSAPAAAADLQRAVGVLCDVQGHSHDAAAALLGQPVATVVSLHRASRETAGVAAPREHCRGWFLVSRSRDLTPPEQAAADRHLEICRSCRDALAARAVAHRRIKAAVPVGGTALGGVVAALSALGGGSVAAGTVAAGTAAVLGAGALVAVAPPAAMTQPEPVRPAAVVETVTPPAPPPLPVEPAAPAPAADVPVQGAAPTAQQQQPQQPADPPDPAAPQAAQPPPPPPAPAASPAPGPLLQVEVPPPAGLPVPASGWRCRRPPGSRRRP
jgi:hypothetical protein